MCFVIQRRRAKIAKCTPSWSSIVTVRQWTQFIYSIRDLNTILDEKSLRTLCRVSITKRNKIPDTYQLWDPMWQMLRGKHTFASNGYHMVNHLLQMVSICFRWLIILAAWALIFLQNFFQIGDMWAKDRKKTGKHFPIQYFQVSILNMLGHNHKVTKQAG